MYHIQLLIIRDLISDIEGLSFIKMLITKVINLESNVLIPYMFVIISINLFILHTQKPIRFKQSSGSVRKYSNTLVIGPSYDVICERFEITPKH